MRFSGKVALVVGGANANPEKLMGFAGLAALEIARNGGRVVVGDIDDDAGTRSVELMKQDGFDAKYIHLNVTSERDWKSAVDLTMDTYGRLDILIMAAGIADRGERMASGDGCDQFRNVLWHSQRHRTYASRWRRFHRSYFFHDGQSHT